MRRRTLLAVGSAWLFVAATHSLSQVARLRRIAFLAPGRETGFRHFLDAFRSALAELGYVEGRDLSIEVRWGDNDNERLAKFAAELVARNPEAIVTAASAGVTACRRATSTIPIVFASAADPVEQGFVASLQRPGRNVTGVLVYSDLTAKMVEITREALPSVRRLALLIHDADPIHKIVLDGFKPSARRFEFEPLIVRVTHAEELDRVFQELAARRAEAVVLPTLAFLTSNHKQIVERALNGRLPLISGQTFISEAGGLLSYGTLLEDNYRRAAALVDKILRGANVSELPVEQPSRFYLIANRKTAKAIGATISVVTMLRADRVIE